MVLGWCWTLRSSRASLNYGGSLRGGGGGGGSIEGTHDMMQYGGAEAEDWDANSSKNFVKCEEQPWPVWRAI